MKGKVLPAVSRYILIFLAFLPVLPVLRVIEYLVLRDAPDFPGYVIPTELLGLIHDIFAFSVFSLVMFIPFFFLFLLNKKTAEIIYITFISILAILQVSLVRYFSITLEPLDEVIFSFSFKEILLIIKSSDEFDLISFLMMISPVVLFLLLLFLFRKFVMEKRMAWFMAGFGIAAVLVSLVRPSVSAKNETDFLYHLKMNKSSYFIRNSIGSIFRQRSWEDSEQVGKDIVKYHTLHPEFIFTGDNYPLFHEENSPDVLGPFFQLSHRPPNLVFIIVESLSSACVGDSSWFGNYTPFLDSLKTHSLYWDNFLSISERTFHVLQAMFASVPYGRGEFQKDLSVIPNHYSLISFLKKSGYSSGFFYGGDASFTGYNEFLKKQGLDFLLTYFDPRYDDVQLEYRDFRWGYQDEALFSRSLEVLDSIDREPRIDIYLTLSTHFPFKPPRSEFYLRQVDEIMNRPGYPEYQKQRSKKFRELFSSVLYTDDAIRNFIKAYAKRDDYNNTIFFITGDHAFTEFGNTTISAIEHYHVPMIIYSPMLKEARQFHSVSSHLDLTPSILSMLEERYNIKLPEYSHWLGHGIDTARDFRNIHTLAFTGKNNKTEEYLKNEFYFAKEMLYKIDKGLRTTSIDDELRRKEMKNELKTTVTVYNFTNQNNLFLPPSLYLPARLQQELIYSSYAYKVKASGDGQTYLDLIPVSELKAKYLKLHVDIRFSYMISTAADTNKLPLLTATIENKNYNQSLYHKFGFPGRNTSQVKPGQWYTQACYDNLDVSCIDSLQGMFLKLYFFYQHPCDIQFDSLRVNVRGTK